MGEGVIFTPFIYESTRDRLVSLEYEDEVSSSARLVYELEDRRLEADPQLVNRES